jgi:hypothetical protein
MQFCRRFAQMNADREIGKSGNRKGKTNLPRMIADRQNHLPLINAEDTDWEIGASGNRGIGKSRHRGLRKSGMSRYFGIGAESAALDQRLDSLVMLLPVMPLQSCVKQERLQLIDCLPLKVHAALTLAQCRCLPAVQAKTQFHRLLQ